jgi:MFS family permease
MSQQGRITRWLERAPTVVFMAYALVAAFSTYFCMYAFRKPFAVGTFAGRTGLPGVGEVDTKIVLIIAQILGYCLSKFIGIKVVSEMPAGRRAAAIAVAIGMAELALVLFGVVPAPYNALCLFFNGLPLGMIWGLVFGFLEGRRVSDGLGAGLAASFIVASGFVKTVGKWMLASGVPETWMPAATGALFLLPIGGFIFLLAQLPPPTKEDEDWRMMRGPMDAAARRRFVLAVAPGLVALTIAYVLLTAYRDFRDNFAREIWDSLGYADAPSVLTTAELPVAFGSLLAVAMVMVVRHNDKALLVIHGLLLAGAVLVGGSTLLFRAGMLGPATWMVLVGLGLYMGYVPYNCVLFDRLIPAVGYVGTAGFLIYLTDAFGYLGSVALLLYKNFGQPNISWLGFFVNFSYVTAVVSAVLFVVSAVYFKRRASPASG